MRSGVCALQQTLTAEAASVLKHSLGLARRRGHAQVTPLHVAAALLSSRASLLRRACLNSQSQPQPQPQCVPSLQCRALELCFNVALNRLPTAPGPLLHGQPSLSNALIAALKRAQAHQRRGCADQHQHQLHQHQQQPLLAVRVELEQLIISILDDPSVSRVMREAGFSSTAVKTNLEDSSSASSVFQYCYAANSSGGVFSSPCSPISSSSQSDPNFLWHSTHFMPYSSSDQTSSLFSPPKKLPVINSYPAIIAAPAASHDAKEDDVKLVLEALSRKKRRNTVIVGDSEAVAEGLVAELMGRFDRGEVPEALRRARFVESRLLSSAVSLRQMKRREDVEKRVSELKSKVLSQGSDHHHHDEGVIIYIGDLKWAVNGGNDEERDKPVCFSAADQLVEEIAKLLMISDYHDNHINIGKSLPLETVPKVWIMASASYQTYMKCQMRQPMSLEAQWALQAVSVPSGGLGLSLHAPSSVHDSRIMFPQNPYNSQVLLQTKTVTINAKDHQDHNKNNNTNNNLTCCSECASHCEKEAQLLKTGNQKLPAWLQPHGTQLPHKEELLELSKKWTRLCRSLHQGRQTQTHLGPIALCNTQSLLGKSYSYAESYPSWWQKQNTMGNDTNSTAFADPVSKSGPGSAFLPRFRRQNSCTIEFGCSEVGGTSLDYLRSSGVGKEEKITLALGNSFSSGSWRCGDLQRDEICRILKENVPWQSEAIPSVVEAMIVSETTKRETWLLIQGNDTIGKRRLARAMAESMLGSSDLLLQLDMNQRKRNAASQESKILEKALKSSKKLVVLVEDIDSADAQFMKFLSDGFETGKFGDITRKEANLGNTILILTKCDATSHESSAKNNDSVIQMTLNISQTATVTHFESLKFNHKRKLAAQREIPNHSKNPRTDDKNGAFSRQLSFSSALDLNIKASDEDDNDSDQKPGELSPNSSDLTRETTTELQNPSAFLESIENLLVFNRSPARDREMKELFQSKMEGCFSEIMCGRQNVVSLSVDESVLEEVSVGSASFSNSLFEKWVRGVFQTALKTVRFSGKEKGVLVVRLCLGGVKEEGISEDGFMGSCLPNKIQLSYKD